jgi:hypothetical protein
MRRVITAGLLIFALAACGEEPQRQERQTTAPPLRVQKISEINYDDTVYYGHYRFTDSTGTYDCFVADNSKSSGDASAGGFAMNCIQPRG